MHDEQEPTVESKLLRQVETRPISHDQLVKEVEEIYAGLRLVEAKCIELDKEYLSERGLLRNDQWQSLIALHKQLLHEHHDFLLHRSILQRQWIFAGWLPSVPCPRACGGMAFTTFSKSFAIAYLNLWSPCWPSFISHIRC